MRLASFLYQGRSSWGSVEGDEINDLGGYLSDRYPTLRSALCELPNVDIASARAQSQRLRIGEITWLPVIPNAGKILCVGHNYESHRQETQRAKVDYPSIFIRFADTQVGHEQPIVQPKESMSLDFEGELALVIGHGGRRIREQDALRHVAGYSCFNDASIRDWQWHTQQFTPGKNFPGTGACGPWMVTSDEVGDPGLLSVTTRLNGAVVQSQPTSDMLFSLPKIISYVSSFTTLSPGDIICTGTPGGVGAKRRPPLWMNPGDTVEVDIPGVGLLRNVISSEEGCGSVMPHE